VKAVIAILWLYIGFVAGSLQVLAFSDKWEVLGVVILVTIILGSIAVMRTQRPVKKPKTIPRRASVARNRSSVKRSSAKVISR
jgi:hypothetical protein